MIKYIELKTGLWLLVLGSLAILPAILKMAAGLAELRNIFKILSFDPVRFDNFFRRSFASGRMNCSSFF
jgi:hypothetical protein